MKGFDIYSRQKMSLPTTGDEDARTVMCYHQRTKHYSRFAASASTDLTARSLELGGSVLVFDRKWQKAECAEKGKQRAVDITRSAFCKHNSYAA